MYAKLKPLSPSKTPQGKEPVSERESRKSRRSVAEAEETQINIENFEARLRTIPGVSSTPPQAVATVSPTTGEYLSQIKRRTQDLQAGREVGHTPQSVCWLRVCDVQEREKRRRRVLVQQMAALQEQEVRVYSIGRVRLRCVCLSRKTEGNSSW